MKLLLQITIECSIAEGKFLVSSNVPCWVINRQSIMRSITNVHGLFTSLTCCQELRAKTIGVSTVFGYMLRRNLEIAFIYVLLSYYIIIPLSKQTLCKLLLLLKYMWFCNVFPHISAKKTYSGCTSLDLGSLYNCKILDRKLKIVKKQLFCSRALWLFFMAPSYIFLRWRPTNNDLNALTASFR